MRVKLLSELLGGELVKNCFIWLIAPHTGTHLLQLLYERASGVEDLEHRVPCLNNHIRVTVVGLGQFQCRQLLSNTVMLPRSCISITELLEWTRITLHMILK